MYCWFILCSLVPLVSLVNVHATVSCFQPDTTYRLCSSHGSNISIISKAFTGAELVKECRKHYVEEHLGKVCDHHDHDHDHHHEHDHGHDHTHDHPKPRTLSTAQRYIFGTIAVLIVSALSLVGLLTLPILYKISFKYVLNLFTAVAIGTLFGDAMFHLIPSVFGLHDHNHSNDHHQHRHHQHSSFSVASYQWKILLAVFTLYVFYLLEVFLHWFAHYKHDHTSGHSPHHSHKNNETYQYTRVNVDVDIEHSHLHHNHTHHNLHQHLNTPSVYSNAKSFFNNNNSAPCTPCIYSNDTHVTTNPFSELDGKERTLADRIDPESMTPKIYTSQFSNELDYIHPIVQKLKTIKATGWMVLFGDSIHNFADGLAISAAFSKSLMFGITTTIAVSCHELPHELGDYAILLQSGFSHCRAILWNFLSATTAIIGFLIGSYTSNSEAARQWIFAATIGMFLYIALVDLLPTLLSDGAMELKLFLVVNSGFIFGVVFMFLLAIFEDYITEVTTKYLSYVTL